MTVKTYLINLDRQPDRLAAVSAALDAQGADWVRFAALDGKNMSDADLDRLVAKVGPIPRMTRGARALTATQFAIFRDLVDSGNSHALVLEDDVEISPRLFKILPQLLEDQEIDVLNINRQTTRRPRKKLVVGAQTFEARDGFEMRALYGIHYGTAGYVISRSAAAEVLRAHPFPDMPIDHILFNPNVSKIFQTLRVWQLFPALTRPRPEVVSSIQLAEVAGARSFRNRLKRFRTELGNVPRLLVLLVLGRVVVRDLDFDDFT